MLNKVVVVVVIVFVFFSCKKKYDCHCNTSDSHSGTINDLHYEMWERKKSEALDACKKKFNSSGFATGGVNCVIR
jgi:hypothetical protein